MTRKKNKNIKSNTPVHVAPDIPKQEFDAVVLLGEILPQIKHLFIDAICTTKSKAADGFDDSFSLFIKKFLEANDIVAWVSANYGESSIGGYKVINKKVDSLFANIKLYVEAIKADTESDVGVFLLEYNDFISELTACQRKDRYYDITTHVLTLDSVMVLKFLQKYNKVASLFKGESGKELGILMSLIMLFENINVFVCGDAPAFMPTIAVQNHMSGFLTKFFAGFEADLETFTRLGMDKNQDLAYMEVIMAANRQKLKVMAKQRQQEKLLQAENSRLLQENKALMAQLAESTKQSADSAGAIQPAACELQAGIETELMQLREKLSPSDIDIIIETNMSPIGHIICSAGKVVTQRDIYADVAEKHSLIEMFYSKDIVVSHTHVQSTWVTVFDLFRADIVYDAVPNAQSLEIASCKVDRVYLAKPFEVSEEVFADMFPKVKALIARSDVQDVLANEIAKTLIENDLCTRISNQFNQDNFVDRNAKIVLKGSVVYWPLIEKVILGSSGHESVADEIVNDGRNSPTSVGSLGKQADNATTKHRMLKLDLFEQMVRLSKLIKPKKPVTALFSPINRPRSNFM